MVFSLVRSESSSAIMSDLSMAPRARLFTAFGTALYIDVASGELRHGPIETSPANAVFVVDLSSARPHRRGWLMYDTNRAGAFTRITPIGLNLRERSHGELSLH